MNTSSEQSGKSAIAQAAIRAMMGHVIPVSVQNGNEFLHMDRIGYLKGNGNLTTFHLTAPHGAYPTSMSSGYNLAHYERLVGPLFLRIGQSTIVNLEHVQFMGLDGIVVMNMSGSPWFDIGKSYKKPINEALRSAKAVFQSEGWKMEGLMDEKGVNWSNLLSNHPNLLWLLAAHAEPDIFDAASRPEKTEKVNDDPQTS